MQLPKKDDEKTNKLSTPAAVNHLNEIYDEVVLTRNNSYVEITIDDNNGTMNSSYHCLDPTMRETPSQYDHVAGQRPTIETVEQMKNLNDDQAVNDENGYLLLQPDKNIGDFPAFGVELHSEEANMVDASTSGSEINRTAETFM